MCILFSYISKRVRPNEFKLVILNNRDEYFFRPSAQANFVNENNIYGIDLTDGKEGGTWLGLSKLGKIGVLLNLDRNKYENDENKEGRGFMVPNYLNSSSSFIKYIEPIKDNVHNYNPFNLIGYEKNSDELWDAFYFDNNSAQVKVKSYDSGKSKIFISNHIFSNPYKKTVVGESMFKDVLSKFNNTSKKEELVNKLFEMAKYDANLKLTDSMREEDARQMMREQVFINIPKYGTRTHTLILVDDKNQVTYHEKTIKCPIDEQNPEWIDSVFSFQI